MSLKILGHPETEFKKGEIIIQEATPGGKVFVLCEGAVKVTLEGKDIATCNEAGEIIGEIATIKGCNYGATVTATEDSRFFVIDDLLSYVKQNPEDSIKIMKTLCERIVKMNQNAVS